MANYFRSVHPIWWAIIPPALLVNFVSLINNYYYFHICNIYIRPYLCIKMHSFTRRKKCISKIKDQRTKFILQIAFYAPNLLRVIPAVGPLIADFSIANPQVQRSKINLKDQRSLKKDQRSIPKIKDQSQIVRYTNLFAVAAHAGEGLLALGLSVSVSFLIIKFKVNNSPISVG